MNTALLTILLILNFWNICETKVQDFTFTHRKFVSNKSAYITKFIFGPGQHKYKLKQKIGYGTLAPESKKFFLNLVMVDRHDWNKEIKGCDLLDKSLKTYKVWVDQNGADGNFTKMTTPKFDQRTFVLFYLVDCKENARN